MKKTILKFVLVASLLISSFTISAPIKNIEILGLNAISRGTVLSYLPIETGDDYTTQTSKKIIYSLEKTQFFKDIEVREVNQTLKITVIENPHIKYVDLLNRSEKVINQEMIEQVLFSMNLIPGKIFNKRQLDQFVEQLKAIYMNKGYYGIKITKKVEIDNSNRVSVELDISEGKVAHIKSMHINGNKVQSEQELLNLFKIGKPDFFIINYFTEKDHYSKVALDAGIEALKSHYFNFGYLDFKVIDVKSELSENKQSINILIQVDEGPEYKVGKIEFLGNMLNESSESLLKFLTVSTGNVFEHKKIIDSIKSITGVYINQGYAFAKIDVLTVKDKVAHIVDLKFKLSPKRKVYINRIIITGNTRTQDAVVRREIGIYEGGLYSDEELEESIGRLKRLGFFSDVKMEVSRVKGFHNKINLSFLLEETKTGDFFVGFSHSNSTGASFNVGVQEKNFLGAGNTLNATTSNSKAVKKVNIYFSNPYFTKDKHSISYGIFNKKTDGVELKVESYKVNESGGNIGYGIPITKDTRISADLRFSSRKITCGTTFVNADYERAQCAGNDKTEVKLNINWSNNILDDYNFPTKGNSNNLKVSVALPIADFRYYKFDASHKSYHPFSKNLTLKTNASLGLAKGYNGKELPFFERYYGGGSSSVRGFDFNSLGAKYPNNKAKGGELSVLMGTSIISPVAFLKDSKNMRMSVFIDVGGVSEKAINFSISDFRASAGVGFVWLTPVGPLGVYAAKPFIKKTGDKSKTFEFTIGTSF